MVRQTETEMGKQTDIERKTKTEKETMIEKSREIQNRIQRYECWQGWRLKH